MAKNRKNDSGVRLAPMAKTVLLCAFFVTLGVGYCGYKSQTQTLGTQIKERENKLAELERQNKMRREQLSALCSPVQIDASVKKFKLGLGPTSLAQMIRMVELPSVPETAATDVQSADQRQALADLSQRGN